MRIAIEGCMHGELGKIYETIAEIENREGYKIDLLLCCGDFQATRNLSDLHCMAVPDKYKEMGSFYQYYSGEKKAPVLTIFIGGNHEASNYLQELPFGGWVAPNIYYLGYAGVVEFNGLRIGGLSGIYKGTDYLKGRFESPPYNPSSMRSVYHIRNLDVFRLRQLGSKPDVVMSHDWPRGVHAHGDVDQLLRRKPFFKNDIETDRLGSRPAMEVLKTLKPEYWFSAHLHVKFPAVIEHEDGSATKFLALDKCLPHRKFLQIVTVKDKDDGGTKNSRLRFDPAWISILRSTNHLLSVRNVDGHMPGPNYPGRWDFRPTQEELDKVVRILGGDLNIPENFEATEPPFNPATQNIRMMRQMPIPSYKSNPQTEWFCSKFNLDDPIMKMRSKSRVASDESFLSLSDFASASTPPSSEVTKIDDKTLESFNQDEILLSDEDDDDGDDVSKSVPEEAPVPPKRTFLNLPSPKRKVETETDDVEEVSVRDIPSADADANFVVDTKPDDAPAVKRTLKRRNQAMYVPDEED